MTKILTVELLTIVLILTLISIFTYIDTRQFMLEGFTGNSNDNSDKCKLLLFHADWCGHCKKMKPDWDRVSREFPGRCEEYESEVITQEQKNKYNFKGYPSIYVIKQVDGREVFTEYPGGRSYNDFKVFLETN